MATVDLGTYKAEIVLDDSKFTSKMSAAEKDLQNFESGAGRWGTRLGALATGAIAGLGASIAAVGTMAAKTGIDFNAMMEQSEIAWTTLLGSADEAKKTINDLVQLGAKTPFEFEGLDKSAKLLNMAGFEGEKLKETLVAVGDAVSAVGGGQEELEGVSMALFQMSAKGKASAEEMNQLAERGIPAWEILSETMGKPIPELMKMSEQGKLMADQVIPALVKGMGERFGGAMEKQSQTFNGLMSTLKDNLKSFTAMITSDLFEKIKSFLPPIIDFINRISDAFKNAGWKGVIQEILPPQVASSITQNIGILKQIISDFVAFGKDVWKKYGDEISATAKTTWQAISQTIKGLLEIIRGVIKTVLSLISGDWKGAWEGIKSIAKGIWDTIGGLIKNFTQGIQNTIKSSLEIVKNIFSTIWNGIKSLVSSIWNDIKSVISSTINNIKSTIQNGWNNVKSFISNTLNTIKNTVSSIWNGIKSSISSIINSISKTVSSVFNSVKTNVSNIFNSIKSTVSSVWNGIKSAISTAVNTAKSVVSNAFSSMKSAVSSIMSGIKSTIVSMWNSAVSFLKGINLSSIGKDIIRGLINGIGSMVGSIKKKVEEIASNIPAWAKKILGIRSPSRVMRDEVGKWIAIGLAEGISQNIDAVKQATQQMVDATIPDFRKPIQMSKWQQQEMTKIAKLGAAERVKAVEDWLSKQYELENIQAKDEVAIWDYVLRNFKLNAEERKRVSLKLRDAKRKIDQEIFENEKKYIEERKRLNQLSLMEELRMWEEVASRWAEGSQKRAEAEENIYRLRKEIYEKLTDINNEYAEKVKEVNERLYQDELKAREEYENKVKEINDRLAEDERKLTEEYEKAVEDRTKSLYSFAGIFDEFKRKNDVTGQGLLKNLSDQVNAFKDWQTNISLLAARGIDEGLLQELRDMGPKAVDEIAALNSLSDSELQQYVALWREKNALARTQAVNELEGMRQDMQLKIQQLRATASTELEKVRAEYVDKITYLRVQANAQLEQHKKEWIAKINEIRTGTEGEFNVLTATLPEIGQNAIQGLMDGMQSMYNPLMAKARAIADAIRSTIQSALDIHSPSRVMMEIGKWIPIGLAEGISKNISVVTSATNRMAQATILSTPKLNSSMAPFANVVWQRLKQNMKSGTITNNHNKIEHHYHFNNLTIKSDNPIQFFKDLDLYIRMNRN